MLSYSTLGLPAWDIGDLCVLLQRFGFEGIEIALTPEMIASRGDADFWSRAAEDASAPGIRITCLHLGHPRLHPGGIQLPSLLSADPSRRAYWIDCVAAAFEIATRLQCPLVAATSGLPREDLSREDSWELLLSSVAKILEGHQHGSTFLIEHEPEHFIRTSHDLIELNRRTDGRVNTNLDVGHLEVAGEPLDDAIDRLGPLIRNVHLEDIRDRRHQHLLPGDGDIDFSEVAAALQRIQYSGPVTADLYPFAAAPIPALLRAREAFGGLARAG